MRTMVNDVRKSRNSILPYIENIAAAMQDRLVPTNNTIERAMALMPVVDT